MLTFLSFSSPSHIFTELLQSTYKTTSGILASMIFVPASDTSLKGTLDDGFKALELYSLLQWNDQDEAYSMHKLVQTWAFERLKSDEQVTFCFAASNYLEHLCWSSGDPSALQRRLISHVMPCFVKVRALCHAGSLATEDVVELVSSLAWFLFTAGKFDFAYALQDFCHKCHEQQHLVDPIAYAGSLHCLARCLFGQHKYDAAEPLLRQVLDRRDEPLFGEHVRIKESCQSSLALLLIDRDRSCSEAEQMLRCLLDQQWHRNASEIDKVNTMIILASALMGRKRHIEAENLYRRMLERPRELSSEFQNAVPTYLSKAFRLQGKFAEAEIVAQQESEHALIHGATNSRSQRALMALGKVKLAQKAYAKAAALVGQACDATTTPNHNVHLECFLKLARALRHLPSYHKALAAYVRVVDECGRALGNENRHTRSFAGELNAFRAFLSKKETWKLEFERTSLRIARALWTRQALANRGSGLSISRRRSASSGGPYRGEVRRIRRRALEAQPHYHTTDRARD